MHTPHGDLRHERTKLQRRANACNYTTILLETCNIKLLFMLPWQMECLWYDETSRLLSSTFGPTTSIQNTDLG